MTPISIDQKRVLIIEDNEILINFYKDQLSKYNAVIDVAPTRKKALTYIKNTSYDLYIVDKMLPDGDGVKLIGQGVDPVKTLVISGYIGDTISRARIAADFNIPKVRIRQKPITEKDFEILIDDVFGRKSWIETDILYLSSHFVEWGRNKIKKMNTKQVLVTVFLIFFASIFLPTYQTWKSHRIHDKFEAEFFAYAEKEFKHFKKGDKITLNTYLEGNAVLGCDEVTVRAYPKGIMWFHSSCEVHGTKEYWLNEESFLQSLGISSPDDTFLDILFSSWKTTKKSTPKVMLP